MWKTSVLVLLFLSYTLALSQQQEVKLPEQSSTLYDLFPETRDDLWAENDQDNQDDEVEEIWAPKTADTSVEQSKEVAGEPVDIIDELNNWDDKATNDEMYDYHTPIYSDDIDDDKEQYPGDEEQYPDEDVTNWPNFWPDTDAEEETEDNYRDAELDDDTEDNYGDADLDDYSDDSEDNAAPTPAMAEYSVSGKKRGAFTAWHYAIFAIAGAIFVLGVVILASAAVKAVRRPNSAYRRLADPVKV